MIHNPQYTYATLTKEEEFLLFIDYSKTKSEEVRKKIIQANYRLLLSIVGKFEKIYSLDPRELFQEGFLGLCKAIDKFNPNIGYKFSTYATGWIRIYIWSLIKNYSQDVKITEYGNSQLLKYKKEGDYLLKTWSKVKYNNIKNLSKFQREKLPIRTTDELRKDISKEELKQLLSKVIDNFPAKEKVILRCRFKLNHGNRVILEEIAYPFNITKERVRQIQKKALSKCKIHLKRYNIKTIGDIYGF